MRARTPTPLDARSARRALRARWALVAGLALAAPAASGEAPPVPEGAPDARVDLATPEGVALVRGEWRTAEARLVEVPFRSAGPDRKPSGPPNRTLDVAPAAGARDFDDAAWERVAPDGLDARRGSGRVSFQWYRIGLTIPERVDGFETAGATAVFEVVVDDYAEVWVDGVLPWELGQRGGTVVAGMNAPNRVVVARPARPGQRIQLAIFGMNGPISLAPENFVWVRSASLAFYREPRALRPVAVETRVERLHPELDAVLAPDAALERVASGFEFTEGPVWLPDGALLFSDPNANRIWRLARGGGLSLFRDRSGYAGADVARYAQPGSNGLALDPQGRLTVAEHGNRRVTRVEPDGSVTVLAAAYEGRRLHSPNDLVYRADGTLYFTDPPFGLPATYDDPARELDWYGVYRLRDGVLRLEARDLRGPNGVALSPDERFLYVANWDPARKIVMRYPVAADGALGAGEVFLDLGAAPGPEALDGVDVDRAGRLFVSGPGGLYVAAPDGRLLGVVRGPETPANFAFGGRDGRTLYWTARTGVYRLRVREPGAAHARAAHAAAAHASAAPRAGRPGGRR